MSTEEKKVLVEVEPIACPQGHPIFIIAIKDRYYFGCEPCGYIADTMKIDNGELTLNYIKAI